MHLTIEDDQILELNNNSADTQATRIQALQQHGPTSLSISPKRLMSMSTNISTVC